MKLWFKKIWVVLITFMTLGMFIPPTYLEANAEQNETVPTETDLNDIVDAEASDYSIDESQEEDIDQTDYYVSYVTERAKEQTLTKLGPKILKQVEPDLMTTILPNIEAVIKMILEEAGDDELHYFEITEQPSEGYGEKIFHVYDHLTKKDVAKFHVRRDNRPKQGFWFNFHYHLEKDGFEEHHQIGDVFWSKDTPPKWMS